MSRADSRGFHLAVWIFLVGAGAVAVLALVATRWDGPEPILTFLTSCSYKLLSGHPCPLCGTTRATVLLLSGDISASLAENPLAAAIWPLGASQLVYRTMRIARPRLALKEELLVDASGVALSALILWACAG